MGLSNLSQKVRVAIVDGHVLFRQVLRRILDEQADLHVVAELSDCRRACEVLRETRTDLLLLDLEMPNFSAYQLLREVRESSLDIEIVILTGSEDRLDWAVALDLGARGLVQKRAATEELLQAIRQVHLGRTWLDDQLRPTRMREGLCHTPRHARPTSPQVRWEELTRRQAEVAEMVTQGLRYKEIAQRLNVSPSTLNNHLRSIFEKLDVHGRVELALYGLRQKL